MTCEQIEEWMADAVADELSDADRAAFDKHLATCGRCRSEYESLREALTAMASVTGPKKLSVRREGERVILEEAGGQNARSADSVRARPVVSRGSSLLRYAAGVLVAFAAGYWYSAVTQNDFADGTRSHFWSGSVRDDGTKHDDESLQHVLARVYSRAPGHSTLAKGLIAVARAGR